MRTNHGPRIAFLLNMSIYEGLGPRTVSKTQSGLVYCCLFLNCMNYKTSKRLDGKAFFFMEEASRQILVSSVELTHIKLYSNYKNGLLKALVLTISASDTKKQYLKV